MELGVGGGDLMYRRSSLAAELSLNGPEPKALTHRNPEGERGDQDRRAGWRGAGGLVTLRPTPGTRCGVWTLVFPPEKWVEVPKQKSDTQRSTVPYLIYRTRNLLRVLDSEPTCAPADRQQWRPPRDLQLCTSVW